MSELRIVGPGGGVPQRLPGGRASGVAPANAAAPSAPKPADLHVSQKVRLDPQAGLFVLIFRDRGTGEVTLQIPSGKAAAEYRKASAGGESEPAAPQEPDAAAAPLPVASAPPRPTGGETSDA